MPAALPLLLVLSSQFGGLGGGTQPNSLTNGIASGETCATCHASGNIEELPVNRYAGSMMQLASVDPLFLAALEVAQNDSADLGEPDGPSLCVRCHLPAGWVQGRTDGSTIYMSDRQGISCDLCHRMGAPSAFVSDDVDGGPGGDDDGGVSDGGSVDGGDVDAGPDEPTLPPFPWDELFPDNAQWWLADDGIKRGPHADAVSNTTHDSEGSALFTDGRLCAHCHNVSNPLLERHDPDTGAPMGMPMPVERTYVEWTQSIFSEDETRQTCQDCHMPARPGVAANQGNPPERMIADHAIVGGNTLGPRLVDALPPQDVPMFIKQGLTNNLETIVGAAQAMLEDAAELTFVEAGADDDGPFVLVEVLNKSGHKLPTGYAEGRRMWLAHTVKNNDGSTAHSRGGISSSTWDFIEGQEPLQIYETKLGEASGPSFHFIKTDRIFKDTRIPPEGFVPDTDTMPVNGYAEETGGVYDHFVRVPLDLGAVSCFPATVDVKLEYQTASGPYYDFLRANAPNYAPTLEAAWNAAGGGAPATMATLSVVVDADDFPPGSLPEDLCGGDGDGDAGDGDGDAGDGDGDAGDGDGDTDGGDGDGDADSGDGDGDTGDGDSGDGDGDTNTCACAAASSSPLEGLAALSLVLTGAFSRRRRAPRR